ncbi:MAG: C25 family cysteine peptidase [Bacteroidaceae bacterium]
MKTGNFISDCFAERFLKHPNGGAVGVIAASATSYSGYNDALTLGLFDAIWSNPGLTSTFRSTGITNPNYNQHDDIYAMGDVLNQGLLRMNQVYGNRIYSPYTFEIFHYFGDPSMEIYTSTPQTFDNVTVLQNGTSITVDTGGVDNCRIVLYSKNDNGATVFSVIEGVSNYTFSDISVPCSVSITKHNYIPYIFNDDIFLQNCTVSENNVYSGNNIYVGREINPNNTKGDVIVTGGGKLHLDANGTIVLGTGFYCQHGGCLYLK